MRLTSEQFADEMMKDIEAPSQTPSFADALANMEKRISERIAETEKSIFSKFDELVTPEKTPEEVTEIEPNNDVEIETETMEEEKEI